jgi:hypothetical protein
MNSPDFRILNPFNPGLAVSEVFTLSILTLNSKAQQTIQHIVIKHISCMPLQVARVMLCTQASGAKLRLGRIDIVISPV